MLLVAFRAHVWDAQIELLARRLYRASAGTRFVVIANETDGELNTWPFDKVTHTTDFSEFGLPAFPAQRTLWNNGDYPLYLLRKQFPDHQAYALVEYDVLVNFDMTALMQMAVDEKIDFVGTHIMEAAPDFPWYDSLADRFAKPMRALIPMMIVSGRAIDHMLDVRQAIMRTKVPTEPKDWPFVEGFIPSAIAQLPDAKMFDFSTRIGCPHFWVDEPIHFDEPHCRLENTINHPVMSGERFIRRCFSKNTIDRLFRENDPPTRALQYYHPREFVPFLQALVLGRGDPLLEQRFETLCRDRHWV